jgi:cytochrome c biogenesis factor
MKSSEDSRNRVIGIGNIIFGVFVTVSGMLSSAQAFSWSALSLLFIGLALIIFGAREFFDPALRQRLGVAAIALAVAGVVGGVIVWLLGI